MSLSLFTIVSSVVYSGFLAGLMLVSTGVCIIVGLWVDSGVGVAVWLCGCLDGAWSPSQGVSNVAVCGCICVTMIVSMFIRV